MEMEREMVENRVITTKKPISKIKVGIGIAIAVIVFVILIILNCCIHDFFTFTGDGFRVLGKFAKAEYQEKCYFYDSNGKVVGDSTFTVSGILYDKDKRMFSDTHSSGTFYGHMEVDAYPLSMNEGYLTHSGVIVENGLMLMTHKNRGLDLSMYYWVFVLDSDTDVVVIEIAVGDGEYVTAVCGENEEEALKNYQKFRDEFYK